MHDIMEGTKIDTALQASTNVTSLTGEWYSMTKYPKALFLITVQGQLTGASMDFSVYEATDAAGSGKSILGAAISMAQGIKIAKCSVAFSSIDVDDTIIIQPYTFASGVLTAGTALTFTAKASETLASRYFNQAAGDTATGASFAACVNDATYGVPGMLAAASSGTVTLTMTEPGEGAFTITESDVAKSVVTDLIQQAAFEVAVQDLDRDNDFTHVGARVAGVDATTEFSAVIIRAMPGYGPVNQAVAYSDDAS